jgi:hypothetical protein
MRTRVRYRSSAPEGKERDVADHDPGWLRRLKQSTLVIGAGLAGALLASGFEFADKVLRITDRLQYTSSEALILARESEKSKFSDALIRGAYRRLMLADIFARRVQDNAASEKVEDAWKMYVAALIDWNADVMINIVGLEIFYSPEKSYEFETVILPRFNNLDKAVRSLYLSRAAQTAIPDPLAVSDKFVPSAQAVFDSSLELRNLLYVFIRCFKEGLPKERAAGCTMQGSSGTTPELSIKPPPRGDVALPNVSTENNPLPLPSSKK